jgi:hypothetical protein
MERGCKKQEGRMQYLQRDIVKPMGKRTAARKIFLSQGHVHKAERIIRYVVFVKNSNLQTTAQSPNAMRTTHQPKKAAQHNVGAELPEQRTSTGSTPFHVKGPAFQLKTGFKSSLICAAIQLKTANRHRQEAKKKGHTTRLV